ncbi:ABC transporter ATP-binding protein [Streptococcus pneumoniae]|nr:ABC transporter ATP-binding protein [Streptococcus pneumoniae]VJJ56015.1 ABC transporter ATP-binding protein [Streptococcus pneumoniae]VJQ02157.1 ABC transporter ATP-binding protein [Streptococcus pneumoniae]VMF60201.1 ABC transporter ATP-binding protein [Streptococcus pneumoniae]VMX96244.1 ABC transporter ATP-binding protein [Streptococcus pneumoniae]
MVVYIRQSKLPSEVSINRLVRNLVHFIIDDGTN